jgi:hypothetical protein
MFNVYLRFFLTCISLDFFISESGSLLDQLAGHPLYNDIEDSLPELGHLLLLEQSGSYLGVNGLNLGA